jgi:NADH dehydrogenase FAD-containing subunit
MVYIVDILSSALATILSFLTAGLYTPGPAALTPTEYASMKRKSIVIVGGSYAGVGTAHRVLKQAARAPRAGPFKVTLVSRDTHMYWNIAAPRALIPGQLADDEIFRSVTEGFAQYPAEEFEFVLGSATGVDTDGKTLQVEKADGTALELGYDYLVVATGARSMLGSPFKSLGSTESTKEGLRALQERIKKAKTIVVGGAGPTGTEVAGELADEYGKDKTVTLVSFPEEPSPINGGKAIVHQG